MAPVVAHAEAGSLDPAFGGDGRVRTDLVRQDRALAVAVQPDGKIVVLGATGAQFALARYTRGGRLDAAFADQGVRVLAGFDAADLAIQPDGKIVVAGSFESEDFDDDFALQCFNSDGKLDVSFGDAGLAGDDGSFNGNDEGRGMALQPDGRIVIVGWSDAQSEGGVAVLTRFTSNGTLDSSLGGDGILYLTGMGDHSLAHAVSIRTNGKIVVAGAAWLEARGWRSALARRLSDGAPDLSFNGDGYARSGAFSRSDVAVQTDGKVVVAGSASTPMGSDFGLARYARRGKLDPTFSHDGKKLTDFHGGDDAARALVLQANGRIVVAGTAAPAHHPSKAVFGLARYRTSGKLDHTFSRNGKQVTRFGPNYQDHGGGVALRPNGRIVVRRFRHPCARCLRLRLGAVPGPVDRPSSPSRSRDCTCVTRYQG